MAKRQKRISNSSISKNWPEISGKKVNIVLLNGTVFFATANAFHEKQLKFINMRLKEQIINTDEISEIIIDY